MRTTDLNIVYEHRECDLRVASQRALELSRYEWLLKWDGDFIANTSGERDVRRIRNIAMALPRSRYYMISYPLVCVDYDLFHVRRGWQEFHEESWLFTYHPFLHYEISPKFEYEIIRFPLFFRRLRQSVSFGMHLRSVKNPLKLLERRYQTPWLKLHSEGRYLGTVEDFVKERIASDFGTSNLVEASHAVADEMQKDLIPYEKERLGDYPAELKEYAKQHLNIEL